MKKAYTDIVFALVSVLLVVVLAPVSSVVVAHASDRILYLRDYNEAELLRDVFTYDLVEIVNEMSACDGEVIIPVYTTSEVHVTTSSRVADYDTVERVKSGMYPAGQHWKLLAHCSTNKRDMKDITTAEKAGFVLNVQESIPEKKRVGSVWWNDYAAALQASKKVVITNKRLIVRDNWTVKPISVIDDQAVTTSAFTYGAVVPEGMLVELTPTDKPAVRLELISNKGQHKIENGATLITQLGVWKHYRANRTLHVKQGYVVRDAYTDERITSEIEEGRHVIIAELKELRNASGKRLYPDDLRKLSANYSYEQYYCGREGWHEMTLNLLTPEFKLGPNMEYNPKPLVSGNKEEDDHLNVVVSSGKRLFTTDGSDLGRISLFVQLKKEIPDWALKLAKKQQESETKSETKDDEPKTELEEQELEEPEIPETPVIPETPEIPEETPEEPEIPASEPETPRTKPEVTIDEKPETPEIPETPVIPETPEIPEEPTNDDQDDAATAAEKNNERSERAVWATKGTRMQWEETAVVMDNNRTKTEARPLITINENADSEAYLYHTSDFIDVQLQQDVDNILQGVGHAEGGCNGGGFGASIMVIVTLFAFKKR